MQGLLLLALPDSKWREECCKWHKIWRFQTVSWPYEILPSLLQMEKRCWIIQWFNHLTLIVTQKLISKCKANLLFAVRELLLVRTCGTLPSANIVTLWVAAWTWVASIWGLSPCKWVSFGSKATCGWLPNLRRLMIESVLKFQYAKHVRGMKRDMVVTITFRYQTT